MPKVAGGGGSNPMRKWEDLVKVKDIKNKQSNAFKANALNDFKDGNNTVKQFGNGKMVLDNGIDFGHKFKVKVR